MGRTLLLITLPLSIIITSTAVLITVLDKDTYVPIGKLSPNMGRTLGGLFKK